MRKFLVIFMIVGGLMLVSSGCRHRVDPKPTVPEMDIPESWRASSGVSGDVVSEWWSVLDDPELDEVIREVLDKNQDIKIAVARLDAARAQAVIAGADIWPNLSGEGSAARMHQNVDMGIPMPGGESSRVETTTSQYGVSLNVSWELDLWGRLRAMRLSATSAVEAGEADLAGVRLSMAGQAAKVYFAAREAARQLEISSQFLETSRLTAVLVERRYQAGLVPPERVREVRNALSTAEADRIMKEVTLAALLRQLEVLMDRYPDGELEVSPGIGIEPPDIPAGVPSEILRRRPDLKAAERRLLAADADLKAARAALLPSIRLTGSAGLSSESLSDLVHGDFSVWNLAAGLMQPIFQGGRLKAGIDLSDARRRERLLQYTSLVLKAFSDVENALNALAGARRSVTRMEEVNDTNAAHLEDIRRRYRDGTADALMLLTAVQQKLGSESRLQAARRQWMDAWIDLNLALGGGVEAGGGNP